MGKIQPTFHLCLSEQGWQREAGTWLTLDESKFSCLVSQKKQAKHGTLNFQAETDLTINI